MKTLNTLLALTLLVSAVAPVCAMEPEAPKAAKPSFFAPVADAFRAIPAIATFANRKDAEGNWNKVEIAKSAALWTAVAAVVAGAGKLAYDFFTSGDEGEEVSAPIAEEQVKTTVETPVVAPVAPTPVVKPTKGKTRSARLARGKNCRRSARKASSCKRSKSSCRPCKA